MNARLTTLLLLLTLAAPAMAEVYRWTDDQGNTVFGDTPPDGVDATPMNVRSPTVTPGLPNAREILERPTPREEAQAREQARSAGYTGISIASPGDDDVVRTNLGEVNVSVQVDPELQSDQGHRVRIVLDGQTAAVGESTRFTLEEVTPGTHTLRAEILDSNDRTLKASEESTFHLLRTTVRQQTRPGGN
ncbi:MULTISPECIES: DUF4124 domain-containing protein [Ectothiorhodospira]|nr:MULTISPECIES: DUF4124 domain-containing protein [Ectothiorhodospira]MCG5494298.1 DUF4124 domain-containing protein [Ectothiorhodospira variabilis]MCG5496463.1 DUF4124 domain-containing protein [Ectothiorhodospira variabilis]MCG5504065.1 DUF4124 domain-containing protein [Ectothiorhodospira variabilis]MCG5507220.1 DUF4124 domain-containing protein [Ectothiorhodospira variabilis]